MRQVKINGDKLKAAILTAVRGLNEGRLTAAEITTEVATVMGRHVSEVEKSIISQKNNTTSTPEKRAFFAKIAKKIEFVTVSANNAQGAPKADPKVWAADLAELDSLLGD